MSADWIGKIFSGWAELTSSSLAVTQFNLLTLPIIYNTVNQCRCFCADHHTTDLASSTHGDGVPRFRKIPSVIIGCLFTRKIYPYLHRNFTIKDNAGKVSIATLPQKGQELEQNITTVWYEVTLNWKQEGISTQHNNLLSWWGGKQQGCSKESVIAVCYKLYYVELCNVTFTPAHGFGSVSLVPLHILIFSLPHNYVPFFPTHKLSNSHVCLIIIQKTKEKCTYMTIPTWTSFALLCEKPNFL